MRRRTLTVLLSVFVGVTMVGTTVLAAVSFEGQGTLVADALTSRKHLSVKSKSSKIQLNGQIYNSASGKPLNLVDDVIVTGTLGVTNGIATTGNVVFTGSLFQGDTDLTSRIDENRTATNALYDFVQCVHDLSSYSGYVESADFTTCWNIWIAGTVSDPPVP